MEGEKLEISEWSEGFGVKHACDFFGGCFVWGLVLFWHLPMRVFGADRWGRTRRFHHVGPILVPQRNHALEVVSSWGVLVTWYLRNCLWKLWVETALTVFKRNHNLF